MGAQEAKRASGDSVLSFAVEQGADRAEDAVKHRIRAVNEVVRGKLSMFAAKHSVDFVATVALHAKNAVNEERGIVDEFKGIDGAIDEVLGSASACNSIPLFAGTSLSEQPSVVVCS